MPEAKTQGRVFKGLQAVRRHLIELGYQLAKNTVYDHARTGKLKPRKDGLFHEDDVLRYAQKFVKKAETKATPEGEAEDRSLVELTLRAKEAAARMNELKLQKAQGELVERDWFEREVAKRTAVFKETFLAFCREAVGPVIQTAGGEPERAPEVQACLVELAHQAMDRLARSPQVEIPTGGDHA
ncbi:MAG: helix-turn-helix domain-containing protein [Deltaproteobacteria bacterium]|nr:helix-turn-helix domain-containing protein [Deltaproteobacteria bacterium]